MERKSQYEANRERYYWLLALSCLIGGVILIVLAAIGVALNCR